MGIADRAHHFELRWGDLARYNAERARGIVHTPEWDARMAEKQVRYNAILAAGGDLYAEPTEVPT